MTRPYVVFTTPYYQASAGTKVQHLLVDHLNKAGCRAYLNTYPVNIISGRGVWWTPIAVNEEHITYMMREENGIAIYPENLFDNVFNAKPGNIVRYALSKPGLFGGPEKFDSKEHVYTYTRVLSRFIDKPEGVLHLPHIEEDLFKNPEYERNVDLIYFGKTIFNNGRLDLEKKKKMIEASGLNVEKMEEITKWPIYPATRRDLAELLKHGKTLYCFDKFTALYYEAALCGCPTVIIDDGNLETVEGDLGANGIGLPVKTTLEETFEKVCGISIGIEGLEEARKTVGEFPEVYRKETEKYRKALKKFIEVSQEY